jgi:hypothetical protein
MNQYGFCDYPTYTINGDGSRGICSGCGFPVCKSERRDVRTKYIKQWNDYIVELGRVRALLPKDERSKFTLHISKILKYVEMASENA